jgi:glycosyltransferase involved in cell wall biosynthesis
MQISVIIPTHNRSRILHECLAALFKQDFPQKDYEVIVVDDGSKDDTKTVVHGLKDKRENLYYFHQQNQGQGIARNLGVTHANGNIVIFIGDDIIVKRDFLTEHVRVHLRHPEENAAALGFVAWHPKLRVTSFMQWLTNGSSIFGKFGGHQFAYEKLHDKAEADYNFFYTSNISLKRILADKYPFDPSFSGYGWEDIELGYRLHKRVGLKIYYNARAIGFHDHEMTEDSLPGRMRSIGKSAWIINAKYPELKKVPGIFKQFAFMLLSNAVVLGVFRFIRNFSQGRYGAFYYYALSKKYFMEGLHEQS